eukprot:gene15296-21381_t
MGEDHPWQVVIEPLKADCQSSSRVCTTQTEGRKAAPPQAATGGCPGLPPWRLAVAGNCVLVACSTVMVHKRLKAYSCAVPLRRCSKQLRSFRSLSHFLNMVRTRKPFIDKKNATTFSLTFNGGGSDSEGEVEPVEEDPYDEFYPGCGDEPRTCTAALPCFVLALATARDQMRGATS